MLYHLDSVPANVIDKHRTGRYGEEFYGDEYEDDYDYTCQECGCDIHNDTVFDFNGKLLCTECFSSALVDRYADKYETTVEDFYDKY